MAPKIPPLKGWLPLLVSITLFLVINLLYFAPQFRGEVLPQGDIIQYEGMTRDINEHRAQYGEDPQWAGAMFSGMPAYLINVKYQGAPIRTLTKAFYFIGQPASLIFLSMLCFYLMLLCLGINPWVGIIPSLAYGFSSYFFIIIGAGHMTKMMVMAFVPMLFGGIFYAYRKNIWLGAAIAALFGSVIIGVNHPQIVYYFLLVFLAFFINEFVIAYKERTLARFAKATAALAVAAILAVGSNISMLYYIQSHSSDTIRGGSELTPSNPAQQIDNGLDLAYATMWSYGKGETFNLLIPNLYGGTSEGGFSAHAEVAEALGKYNARQLATKVPGYWGDQPGTSGPVYIGAVAIFLSILGLFLLRGRAKWWLAGVTLLAILLSWGNNMMWLTELFFRYVPMYNKFRTVSMILVIVEWTVPLLVALTLQQIWMASIPRERLIKGLKLSTAIAGGICLLVLLLGSSTLSFSSPSDVHMGLPEDVLAAMRAERASLLRSDAFRSLLFVLLSAGVVWIYAYGRLTKRLFIMALVALVIIDMVPVNLRYLNADDFVASQKNQVLPTQADKEIMADKELGFRVMNQTVNPFSDAKTSYFHRSVGGYHGAKLSRYQDLIERQLSQGNIEVFNMLNTKYFIVADKSGEQSHAIENPEANGPAWLVREVDWVDTPDAEMAALDSLYTQEAAVVDRRFEAMLKGVPAAFDSTASIRLVDYRANLQRYRYASTTPSVAIFSEIYYPKGWKAYIDGVEAPYFRANYVLRAMVLPAGEHEVEFRFSAPHYRELSTINLIFSLLLLGGLAASVVLTWIKCRKDGRA